MECCYTKRTVVDAYERGVAFDSMSSLMSLQCWRLFGHVHLSCVVVGHCKNHQKQFFAINQPINDISLPNFQGIYKTI